MPDVLIGLGGNLGDVRANLDRAVGLLCGDGRIRLLARSSNYRTPPWGREDQPPFINCCLMVETDLPPHSVLDCAQAVERALGRDRAREQRWGPRTVDIDLLTYGDIAVDEPDLTLPHPRLFERAFVLVPLLEIVPSATVAGRSIREALARLDTAAIERLPPA